MVKAVFFDMWGTLIENGIYPSPLRQVKSILRVRLPFPVFVSRFEHAFMTKSFDTHLEGFKEATQALEVNPPDFVYDKLVGLWNKYMILAKLYDETVETLETLKKDYKLVLVANADRINSEQVLEKFDLKKYFDILQLSWDCGQLKSNPKIFEDALDKLELGPEDVVMVGDSIQSDLENAEQAGIKGILVDRRGKREYENKVESLAELPELLKKFK